MGGQVSREKGETGVEGNFWGLGEQVSRYRAAKEKLEIPSTKKGGRRSFEYDIDIQKSR